MTIELPNEVTVPEPEHLHAAYLEWNKDRHVGEAAKLNLEDKDVGAVIVQNNQLGIIIASPLDYNKNVIALYELQTDFFNVMVLDKLAIKTLQQKFASSGLVGF